MEGTTSHRLKSAYRELWTLRSYIKRRYQIKEDFSRISTKINDFISDILGFCELVMKDSAFCSEVIVEELNTLFSAVVDEIRIQSLEYKKKLPKDNCLDLLLLLQEKLSNNYFLDSTVVQRSATNYSVPPEVLSLFSF